MARCAIIENGIVVNMAEASEDFAADQGWIASDVAQIGWTFDGENFVAPPRYPDIAAGKAELLSQINAKRDELETHGFPHAGLWFQSDERSVARINSTALMASAALITGATAEFPDWISADNTPLPVDAQEVLALQASLTRHGGALHAHARSLKARVQAAQTADDLAAIDITAGWPV